MVASAYAFAQLFRNDYSVGGSALSLSIAAGMAENLVSAQSGSASTIIQTSPNGYETNTWSALGTLANVLAGCTQGVANACTNLFALTPSSNGITPTNTLQAIVNIALNSAVNVSDIYNLGSVVTSYTPALTANQGPNSSAPLQKLDAWTMAVEVNNSGSSSCPFGGPANVAFDVNGYDGGISKLFTVSLPSGSNPKGVAVDSLGNAWVAAGAISTVYAINTSGTIVGTYTGQGINGPWGVSLDAKGNVWVANFGVSLPSARYSVVQLCGATGNCPYGVSMGSAITPSTGYILLSGSSQVLLNSGQPLYGTGAPPSYLPLMRLTSVNADMAGNIWAANNWKPSGLNDLLLNPGGDGMVIFVGIAAPTKAPSLGPAQTP